MRAIAISTLAVAAAVALAACGPGTRQVQFDGSDRNPAARGEVKAKLTDNGNTQFDVKVEHLAEPNRVAPNATTYVVWIRPAGADQGLAQNAGALRVDDKLTGTLTGITPYKNFDVFITAEPQAATGNPAGPEVLTTTVRQD
jgi:hypothetical protein